MIAWLRRRWWRWMDDRRMMRDFRAGLCGVPDCGRPWAPYLVEDGRGHWTLCPEHKREEIVKLSQVRW